MQQLPTWFFFPFFVFLSWYLEIKAAKIRHVIFLYDRETFVTPLTGSTVDIIFVVHKQRDIWIISLYFYESSVHQFFWYFR